MHTLGEAHPMTDETHAHTAQSATPTAAQTAPQSGAGDTVYIGTNTAPLTDTSPAPTKQRTKQRRPANSDGLAHRNASPDTPRCIATNRQGNRCGSQPIPGGTVCRMHGGAAPQVQRKARLRLLELIDPAISLLANEMSNADKSADRQRAANSILDRAGVPRVTKQDDAQTAREMLLARLIAMREEATLPALPPLPDGVNNGSPSHQSLAIIDAEIID